MTATLSNTLILFGGYITNYLYDDVWYFNLTSSRWLQKTDFVHPQYSPACTDDVVANEERETLRAEDTAIIDADIRAGGRRLSTWVTPYLNNLRKGKPVWAWISPPRSHLEDNEAVIPSSPWYNGTSSDVYTHVQCGSVTNGVWANQYLMTGDWTNCTCIVNGTYSGDWVNGVWSNVRRK